MKSFQDILQNNGEEFISDLMNNYLLVYEKLNASTLSFKRIGEELHFYKGRDTEEITDINSTLYNYFQDGIDYIKRVSLIFFREFPEGWLFKMQYFIDNKTNLIEYEYLPQNNLVLSCIDNGSALIEDPEILKRWAERLQIDYSQPVFQGFLSEFQKEKINDFINGKVNISEISFSKYMMTVLNPASTHSAYRSNFDGGVDSFIFKFYKPNSKKSICAKIVDPYMAALVSQKKNEFGDNCGCESEIILANFIAYLQTIDLNEIKADGDTDEEKYMDVICKLFNQYIKKEQKLFKDIKSDVNESFSVNIDKIRNRETAELLKSNPNLTTAFQVIVGNFAQHKNPNAVNPLSLINSDLINVFNKEVNKIKSMTSTEERTTKTFDELINAELGKDIETAAKESSDGKVMTFTELMGKIGVDLDKDDVEEVKGTENTENTENTEDEHTDKEEDKSESSNDDTVENESDESTEGDVKKDEEEKEGGDTPKTETSSSESKGSGNGKEDNEEAKSSSDDEENDKNNDSDSKEEKSEEEKNDGKTDEDKPSDGKDEKETDVESEEDDKSNGGEDKGDDAKEEKSDDESGDEAKEEKPDDESGDEENSNEKSDTDNGNNGEGLSLDTNDGKSDDGGENASTDNDKGKMHREDSEPKAVETKKTDAHSVADKPDATHNAPTPTHEDNAPEKKETPKNNKPERKPKEEPEAPTQKPAPKSKPQPSAPSAPSAPEPQVTL